MGRNNIRYDVIKENENGNEILESFVDKQQAINYAKENGCSCVVKFNDYTFEPLGVVWEKE